MLNNLWRWIQLWLPYGLILWMYRRNKALPTNIRTREGNNFKAMMITEDYGILFSEDKYIRNRGAFLLAQKKLLEQQNNEVISELNSLNVIEREKLYRTKDSITANYNSYDFSQQIKDLNNGGI